LEGMGGPVLGTREGKQDRQRPLGVSKVGCNRILSTPQECVAGGGEWLAFPYTQETCEGEYICDTDDEQGLLYPKENDTCVSCDGSPVSPRVWRSAEYNSIPGEMVNAEWIRAEYAFVQFFRNDTVMFEELHDFLEDAVAALVNRPLYNYFLCETVQKSAILNTISCGCGDDIIFDETSSLAEVEDACLAGISLEAGRFQICGFDEVRTFIWAGGFSEFDGRQTVGQETKCVFGDIFLSPFALFDRPITTSIGTMFGDPGELDALPVRNGKGAAVGIPIGQGVRFDRKDGDEDRINITYVKVCLTVFEDMLETADAAYGAIDIGYTPEELPAETSPFLRPFGQGFNRTEDLTLVVCVKVESSYFNEGYRFYPIVRHVDWQQKEEEELFTTGEKAVLYIIGFLYLMSAVVCIAVEGLFLALNPNYPNIALLFFLILMLIIRGVYFFLLAPGVLGQDEDGEQDVDFVLIELPSFLYVSACSVLAMSFLFFVKCSEMDLDASGLKSTRRKFWALWGLFNAILYVYFVVNILLLTQLDHHDTIDRSCAGRVISVEENDTVEILRVTYHAVLCTIAAIMMIVIGWAGVKIYTKVQLKTLIFLCTVSGVSLFILSVAWIIYVILDGGSAYFSIVMYTFEGIPSLIIAWLIRPRNLRRLKGASTTRSFSSRRTLTKRTTTASMTS